MKFSDVIGAAFFKIGLTPRDRDLIDAYFSGAAHHYARWLESDAIGPASFHHRRFLAHLRHLMLLVYERGDFAVGPAQDESLRGLERRERWNPDVTENGIPDPLMFEGVLPDRGFPPGMPHDLDRHLRSLQGPASLLLSGREGIILLAAVGTA